jgi:hypothetical protein
MVKKINGTYSWCNSRDDMDRRKPRASSLLSSLYALADTEKVQSRWDICPAKEDETKRKREEGDGREGKVREQGVG